MRVSPPFVIMVPPRDLLRIEELMVSLVIRVACTLALLLATSRGWSDEKRAPAPKYSANDTESIFFEDFSEAFRGQRPTLAAIRASAKAAVAAATNPASSKGADSATSDEWSPLISPISIEDEVKRLKLHFDSVVTTPGVFNSGGYMEARLDLTILAMMFAVINEHSGDVRWKSDSASARDLLARTAFNCKAGSIQVYNEANLRKADLQDLISGAGLSTRDANPESEWGMIVDRSPLMEYAETLIDSLEDATRDAKSVTANPDQIRRQAELLSVFAVVLTKEGLDEADDEDYTKLSMHMVEASQGAVAALDRGDADEVRKNVSAIRQRCDVCHEQYR
jgi:cytochrome c556